MQANNATFYSIAALDQAIYPRQPFLPRAADFILTPLSVALQGRTITWHKNHHEKMQITHATHGLAIRLLCGLAALLLLPLTLGAYIIKSLCMDAVRKDLRRLAAGYCPLDAKDEARSTSSAKVCKVAEFSEPLIDLNKREIEFYESFERENPHETKGWIDQIGDILKVIAEQTGRRASAFEYFGMGQGDYYLINEQGQCILIDSEEVKYGDAPLARYAQEILYSDDSDIYMILLPGRREALKHLLVE
ncbi:hypothetical protein [Estrella lausannensis]|uniref:Putative membrane protein n=1 Tax=Estrella lausannensis TaxID=483423 RepID=A0A0H5DP40_9BACT|nr:hypothetical protein [Estrella lausannensis]CRX38251.1 putative membrane protein [Estrella lausannensis]